MIFSPDIAKKLEALLHPDVENAIKLLLDHVLKEKDQINDNPNCTDAELRQLQGQKVLINELKQYRNRLKDTVTREKERELDVGQ